MYHETFMHDFIVIGGGAAGMFAAITAKAHEPNMRVALLEKSAVLLAKVRVSGGGRCNVTHACFDPLELSKNYPRGSKELIGPFIQFQPRDTMHWFEERGVRLKIEEDGRVFPVSDDSETIISCLVTEAKKLGVEILLRKRLVEIAPGFILKTQDETLQAKHLLLATGSSQEGYTWAKGLGHTIQEPVPSLFTFNVPTSPLKELSGIVVDPVVVRISGTNLVQTGPLLITHFGFSGPAVLKLSAWGARHLHGCAYRTEVEINWLPERSVEEMFAQLRTLKESSGHKLLSTENLFNLPKNLWKLFCPEKRLADCTHKELQLLAQKLHKDCYCADGKTTHKEEFVTCGGVTLKEINFKTMESRLCPNLYFAGEILDIDGITGGFNFQNAWTTGFLAGRTVAR